MKLLIENWRKFINEAKDKIECPEPTQDLELNTKNRDRCREDADYGPMNLTADVEGYQVEAQAEKSRVGCFLRCGSLWWLG